MVRAAAFFSLVLVAAGAAGAGISGVPSVIHAHSCQPLSRCVGRKGPDGHTGRSAIGREISCDMATSGCIVIRGAELAFLTCVPREYGGHE